MPIPTLFSVPDSAGSASTDLVELSKYFQVAADRVPRGQSCPMFSPRIDKAWHELLTRPDSAAAFSRQHAGQVLKHTPGPGRGEIPWVRDYERRFGPLPEVWFTDASGTVDQSAVTAYRETGQVYASWDCDALGGDGQEDDDEDGK